MSNPQRTTGGRIRALILAVAAFAAAPVRSSSALAADAVAAFAAAPVRSSSALAADAVADSPPTRVPVVHYSLTGNTRHVAQAVVEGVKQVSGAQAALAELARKLHAK
ncbi:MAG: hypothetical protein FJ276_12255 [Planctomycetes bacterium]|nr:hypothetical protein [Planctomycetota bacterium]